MQKLSDLKNKKNKAIEPTRDIQPSGSENSLKNFFKKDDNIIKVPARELTKEEKLKLKLEQTEDTLLVVRVLNSIVLTWDITLKIAYFSSSRFSSQMLKQIYLSFLFFRPALLIIALVYRTCLGVKNIYKEKKQMEKKYKDDIAYQKELAFHNQYGKPGKG